MKMEMEMEMEIIYSNRYKTNSSKQITMNIGQNECDEGVEYLKRRERI